jgi:hypothetical protein
VRYRRRDRSDGHLTGTFDGFAASYGEGSMTERRFITPVRAAALSSLLPGAGHWLQGRRRRALLLLLPTAGVAIAAVVLAARGAGYLVGLSVQTGWLWALFAVNLGWCWPSGCSR